MQHMNYQIISGSNGEPVVIEVSISLEKMVRHSLKSIRFPGERTTVEAFQKNAHSMLRFICTDFPKDRIDEFSWHAGDWYVRYHTLLNHHLN